MIPAVILAVVYCALAVLGLRWATVSGAAASPVFPAAGVALAGLLLGGIRLWPAVVIGRLAASWIMGSPLPLLVDLSIALGNGAAAAAGAQGLRWAGADAALPRLRDLPPFLLVTAGSAAISAMAGTLALSLGTSAAQPPATTWLQWWAGTATGVLVMTPLIMSWLRGDELSRDRRWWLHLGGSAATACLGAWVLFGPTETPLLRTFLVFPLLMWSALACGVRGATTAMVPVAAVALWGTTAGYGPLATAAEIATGVDGPLRFLLLQQFIGVASAASLIFAVGADELRGRDALRETQTRLTLALEAGQLGFWDWDVPSGRVQFGGRWATILGYQLDEVEPHVRAWEQLIHPDDLARVTSTLRDHLEWRTEFYECEHRLRHRDGSWRWVLARGRVVQRDDRGKPLRAVGTHADITDRRHAEAALRESEARVRLAAEAAGIGFWDLDVEHRTCVLDEIAAGFVRVAPGSAISLADVAAAVHPDDYAQMRTVIGHATASGDRYEMEFRVLEAGGGVRWIAALGNTVQEQDRPVRLAGVNWDVTDRKRAEQERERLLESERAARTEAEHASRLKDDFLSTVSHELRTPLTAIIGWSQVLGLKVQGRDAELERGLRAIDRNGRAQVQLIEDLLDMSRIVSGKLRLNVQPVDLHEVVEAAVTSVAPSAEAGGLHLQTVLSPTAGVVHGDPQRLQQVVWNLLSNAVKFTPAGGTIQVTLARVGGFAEITVADTGKGISAEFLPHVFDRFRQADASTTRQFGGLGLGLSIVKNLVDLHAGSLRVSSAGEGKGASFTVALPLAVTHASVGVWQGSPAVDVDQRDVVAGEPFDLAGVSVLFVDDAVDAREVVSMLLEERHARVRTAACAEDALRLLEAERPDVIVSDIGMPGMDGYAFIRRVRALPSERGGDVPAVALTAFARADDRTAALLAGFQSHLSKPVHPPELMAAISALVAAGTRASRG